MKPVVVISHERSGTHLCMNMIALNFGMCQWEWIDIPPAGSEELKTSLLNFDRAEVIRKSHHQAECFGESLGFLLDRYVVIYVLRDVCAVMVSCWHYFLNNGSLDFPKPSTFGDFLEIDPREWKFDAYYSSVKSGSMVKRWKLHTDTWQTLNDRIVILKFRELVEQPETAMLKVAIAMGRRPFEPIQIPERGANCVMFRRGAYGSWQDEITLKQKTAIERQAAL